MDTYPVGLFPGERPEKSLVRAAVYAQAIWRDGLQRFQEQHHLVLGGHGGDIPVLRAAGVPPENIHVAELQYPLWAALRQQFPAVDVRHADALVLAACHWEKKFSTINLDLCGKLSDKTVEWVQAVIHLRPARLALVAVTLCGSREVDDRVRCAIARAKDSLWPSTPHYKSYARCEALARLLREGDARIKPQQFLCYTSTGATVRGNTHGMAMCTSTFCTSGLRERGNLWDQLYDPITDRAVALSLRSNGLQAPAIAKMMGRPRQQVAGWFAVDTKSRNKKETA